MTKERLEELIKQGATVWGYNDEGVFDLPLKNTNDRMVGIPAKSLVVDWYAGKGKGWFTAYYDPNKLYETKEQTKWALKTVAERTERFEPPMWEEIEKKYDFYFYIKDISYNFHVNKDLRRIEFSKDFIGVIFLFRSKEFTKENYEKACEIVRDLFKGESNGKEVK